MALNSTNQSNIVPSYSYTIKSLVWVRISVGGHADLHVLYGRSPTAKQISLRVLLIFISDHVLVLFEALDEYFFCPSSESEIFFENAVIFGLCLGAKLKLFFFKKLDVWELELSRLE